VIRFLPVLAGLLLTACGGPGQQFDDIPLRHTWPTWGGDAGGQKYSPLTQINRDNVVRLERAWTYHTGDISDGSVYPTRSSFEGTPILVDGVLYLTTPFGRCVALDPETGTELWVYDPKPDLTRSYNLWINRGAASWRSGGEHRIFYGTLEGQFIAPCCWAKTIDQERSGAANEVREIISAQLNAGASEQGIKDALVARYGLRILAAPPAEGFQLTAWVMPFLAVFIGGIAVVLALRTMLRHRTSGDAASGGPSAETAPPPDDYEQRMNEELRDYEDA